MGTSGKAQAPGVTADPTEEWRRPRRRERQVRPVGRSSVGDHARVAGPRASLTHCGGSCTHTTAASALGLRCPASPPPGPLPGPSSAASSRPRRLCRCIPLLVPAAAGAVTSCPVGPDSPWPRRPIQRCPHPLPPDSLTELPPVSISARAACPPLPTPRVSVPCPALPSPAEGGVGRCSAGAAAGATSG